jgi:AcrR family transcriptional regulator
MPTQTAALDLREEVAALKRARIIKAAVDLFFNNGYENTTLEEIAKVLGVTKPFIYAHFKSKVQLLAEICSYGIEKSQNALESVTKLDLSPYEKLSLFGGRFATAVLEGRKQIAIFTREEKNLTVEDLETINGLRHTFDRKLTELLREGVEAGQFEIEDPHLATLSIGGMVSWSYVWYRETGRLSQEDLANRMNRLILNMVLAKPASA